MIFNEKYRIITASDKKHAPYLVNGLISLKQNYSTHPCVDVYDIGLSKFDIVEILKYENVRIIKVPKFATHYDKNWTWKLYAVANSPAQFLLYIDLPNFVVLRNLDQIFEIIESTGSFFLSTGHRLEQIIPLEYWSDFSLDSSKLNEYPIFGAGIFGINKESNYWNIIEFALELCLKGYNLGRSKNECSDKYWPNDLIRNCELFRADQTVLNLAAYYLFSTTVPILNGSKIYGTNGIVESDNQYLWYSRRIYESLPGCLLNKKIANLGIVNKLRWLPSIYFRRVAKKIYMNWK